LEIGRRNRDDLLGAAGREFVPGHIVGIRTVEQRPIIAVVIGLSDFGLGFASFVLDLGFAARGSKLLSAGGEA
jgi:hypothetical protein